MVGLGKFRHIFPIPHFRRSLIWGFEGHALANSLYGPAVEFRCLSKIVCLNLLKLILSFFRLFSYQSEMYKNLKNFLTPMHVCTRISNLGAQAKHFIVYLLIVLQIKLTFCFINLLFYFFYLINPLCQHLGFPRGMSPYILIVLCIH